MRPDISEKAIMQGANPCPIITYEVRVWHQYHLKI